jgi:hypothetical protein
MPITKINHPSNPSFPTNKIELLSKPGTLFKREICIIKTKEKWNQQKK